MDPANDFQTNISILLLFTLVNGKNPITTLLNEWMKYQKANSRKRSDLRNIQSTSERWTPINEWTQIIATLKIKLVGRKPNRIAPAEKIKYTPILKRWKNMNTQFFEKTLILWSFVFLNTFLHTLWGTHLLRSCPVTNCWMITKTHPAPNPMVLCDERRMTYVKTIQQTNAMMRTAEWYYIWKNTK